MKNKKFKIDLTPSWTFALKGLLIVIESHLKKSMDPETWKYIKKELTNTAKLADEYKLSLEK